MQINNRTVSRTLTPPTLFDHRSGKDEIVVSNCDAGPFPALGLLYAKHIGSGIFTQ